MIRTYTFQYQAGIEFGVVERLAKKVKALTGTNLCVIERAESDSAATREHWGLFTVTVEAENFPAPPVPHVAPNLPPPVLRACAASAICGAFLELRMDTPMVVEVEQVTAWPAEVLVEATLVPFSIRRASLRVFAAADARAGGSGLPQRASDDCGPAPRPQLASDQRCGQGLVRGAGRAPPQPPVRGASGR